MTDAKHTPEEVPWHEIADDVCRTRDSMLAADPELWKGKEKQAFDAARSVIEAIWRASKARRAASTGHTPEPWYLQSGDWPAWIRTARDGYVIVRAESPYFGHGAERENRANGERVVACVNACAGMADPAAEIAELRKKAHGWELLIQAVQAMADTTTEGQPTTEALLDKVKENMELRAENARLRRYVGDEMIRSDFKTAAQMRSQLEHYRNEATALRRNESEAIDAIKAVGYTTPHGESDSLGEAVAWLVKAVEAGDRLADNLTALASDIERGDALAVRAFVRDYRKERAS